MNSDFNKEDFDNENDEANELNFLRQQHKNNSENLSEDEKLMLGIIED